MKLRINSTSYIDTSEPLDLSIKIIDNESNIRAWYVGSPEFAVVRDGNYVGSVSEGGAVNFRNIFFNPHGHGTHTECLGHITREIYSINDVLTDFFFLARLITVTPIEKKTENGLDLIITGDLLNELEPCDALIIRTLPNDATKKHRHYSNSNPPYLDLSCLEKLNRAGIKHLLVDLPSVDREEDGGALMFHHAFWGVPGNENHQRTITEFVYADNSIDDGEYILELQLAAFENDASPSRPILYEIKKS